MRIHHAILLAPLLLLCPATSSALEKPRPLPSLERRAGCIALVADVSSGEIVAQAHAERANERLWYPGSLFKIPLTVAALARGATSPSARVYCHGIDSGVTPRQECWIRSGHGRLDMRHAIASSCNIYFRRLGERLSTEEILRTARGLGIGPREGERVQLTGSRLLGEAWRVSARQLLDMGLIVAGRGRRSPTGLSLIGARWRPLYDGLRSSVLEGTARGAWSKEKSVAGKTGTVGVEGRPGRTIGYFVGYAPVDRPRRVVVVVIEGGRGSDAALLALEALHAGS